MAHQRLFLEDLTDQHLRWLQSVLKYSPWVSSGEWLQEILDGTLKVYDVGSGIIGARLGNQVEIVFIAGEGLAKRRDEMAAIVREIAEGKPVEGFFVHAGMVRLAAQAGFKPVGAYMRLDP